MAKELAPASQTGTAQFAVRYGQIDNAVDTDATHLDTSQSGAVLRSQLGSRTVNWQFAFRVTVFAAAIGFAMGLVTAAIQLSRFLRSAYASGFREDAEINATVKRLCKRLGMKHRIRVRLVFNPIGPVVVGLMQPTILLPEVIVAGKRPSELEPLIAHELIHIRRGDLWWALLQSLATSLWWFHPLVQLASRMVTRESERSCDEETVMSLGCTPSTYARSLLDVLERKHQLQVAPALPGVRPVDVTLKRMERIMKLGHGSHQRAPRWIWGVLMLGCALALPSAAVGVAQDEKPKDVDAQPAIVGPVPKSSGSIADAFKEFRCDVGDLLDILKSQNYSNVEAVERLLEQLPPRKLSALEEVARDLGLPGNLTVNLPEPKIIDRELRVFELRSQIDAIEAALSRLRKAGFQKVTCEVKTIHFALEDFEQIAKDWPELQVETAAHATAMTLNSAHRMPVDSDYATLINENGDGVKIIRGKIPNSPKGDSRDSERNPDFPHPIIVTLDAEDATALWNKPGANCLSAPVIVAVSGQHASITTRNIGATFGEAEVAMLEDTKIDIQPVIADRDSIQLSFKLTISQTPVQLVSEDPSAVKNILQLALNTKVRSGHTLVVSGMPTKVNGKDRIFVVCVTPTIGGIEFGSRVKFERFLNGANPGEYHRLQVLGPITSASDVVSINPPSDDEVFHAIEKKRLALVDEKLPMEQIPKIRLKKMSEWTEKSRFVPLIGNAALHHTLYECELTRGALPGLCESVYIDHVHFHMTSEDSQTSGKPSE